MRSGVAQRSAVQCSTGCEHGIKCAVCAVKHAFSRPALRECAAASSRVAVVPALVHNTCRRARQCVFVRTCIYARAAPRGLLSGCCSHLWLCPMPLAWRAIFK